ncbi:hypothetical protein M413DRAFT_437872 [Hebeloma cylindrosporum]|uniref:Uncharacterized protein n=1 Tax=Hebeloma cylindrosporum TaxID=76867 RepID=A0A0C2Z690_HEBCY|nr:hypothetical protein M413DRAFT_437872 [Hebeloma cylindrosporum h7]
MSGSPEDSLYVVGSPPPAYDVANAGGTFVIPVPATLPQEKAQVTPKAPAMPRNVAPDSLVLPSVEQPLSVRSPARSESSARKELAIPVPPMPGSSTLWSSRVTSSSRGLDKLKAPRLMNVITPYTGPSQTSYRSKLEIQSVSSKSTEMIGAWHNMWARLTL